MSELTPETAARQTPDPGVPGYEHDPDELITIRGRTMRKKRYLWVLLPIVYGAYFLASFDGAIAGSSGPIIIRVFDISPQTLLYSTSAFGVIAMLTSVLAGLFIDRYGRKRVFAIALLGVGLFSGLTSLIVAFWQYIVLRCFAAITESGIRSAQTILIAEEAPPAKRGRLQSLSWALLFLGAAIGGLVTSAIASTGNWRLLFAITFAPMLLVFFVTRYLRESPRFVRMRAAALDAVHGDGSGGAGRRALTDGIERVALRRLFGRQFRGQTIAMMLFGLFCFSSGSFTTLVAPIYLVESRGFSESHASLFVTIMFVSALIGNLPVGWLCDKISPKYVMVLLEAAGALLIAPLLIPGVGDWATYVAFIAMGLFVTNGVVAFAIYLAASFPTEIRGTALSVIMVFVSLGGVLVPLVSAPLIGLADSPAIPLLMLSLPLVAFLAAGRLRTLRAGVDIDQQAQALAGQ
ncbi:MFS transporter [Nonomuraea sp. NPDC002799]